MTAAARIAGKMFEQLDVTPTTMANGKAARLIDSLISADGSRFNGHVRSELGFSFANTIS